MDAITARAGVGKAAIYRRWKNKSELLVDAFLRLSEPATMIDTGDVRADLVALIDGARRKLPSSVSGVLMPRMLGAAINDPELMEVYWRTAVLPRRELFIERLRRAVARGEIRADLDLEVLTDVCLAPTIYRRLFMGVRPGVRRTDIEQSIDIVLTGVLPLAVSPRASDS